MPVGETTAGVPMLRLRSAGVNQMALARDRRPRRVGDACPGYKMPVGETTAGMLMLKEHRGYVRSNNR